MRKGEEHEGKDKRENGSLEKREEMREENKGEHET